MTYNVKYVIKNISCMVSVICNTTIMDCNIKQRQCTKQKI